MDICSVACAAIVLWVFIGILACGAIGTRVQLLVMQTLSTAAAIRVEVGIGTNALVVIRIPYEQIVANACSRWTQGTRIGVALVHQ
jgi:hypothetical protein